MFLRQPYGLNTALVRCGFHLWLSGPHKVCEGEMWSPGISDWHPWFIECISVMALALNILRHIEHDRFFCFFPTAVSAVPVDDGLHDKLVSTLQPQSTHVSHDTHFTTCALSYTLHSADPPPQTPPHTPPHHYCPPSPHHQASTSATAIGSWTGSSSCCTSIFPKMQCQLINRLPRQNPQHRLLGSRKYQDTFYRHFLGMVPFCQGRLCSTDTAFAVYNASWPSFVMQLRKAFTRDIVI